MENNNFENKEKMREELCFLVPVFIATNVGDKRLSELAGMDEKLVTYLITNKEMIKEVFTKEIIDEIFKNGIKGYKPLNGEDLYEEILRRRALLEQMPKKEEKVAGEVDLSKFFKDESKQFILLAHMALQFRVKFSTLAELVNMPVKELDKKIKLYNSGVGMSFIYLNEHDSTDQEIAKNNLLDFYNKLKEAYKNRNKQEISTLLRSVTDYDASILRKREKGDILTDENIGTILNYQLKYSLTLAMLQKALNISYFNYLDRLKTYFISHPELQSRYEQQADFFSKAHTSNRSSRS